MRILKDTYLRLRRRTNSETHITRIKEKLNILVDTKLKQYFGCVS